MDISKKDWKLFRERLSGWQGNYMEGLVKEYVNFLTVILPSVLHVVPLKFKRYLVQKDGIQQVYLV